MLDFTMQKSNFKMIKFSHFNYELDEDSTLLNIKSQMPGHYASLQKINDIQKTVRDFYVLCQIVSEFVIKKDEKLGIVLEFTCRVEEHTCSVIFFKKLAQRIEELILQGKIYIGNVLALQRPAVAVMYNKGCISALRIEMGYEESQSLIIWKSMSFHYFEPFFMQLTSINSYRHVIFYELDYTGSLDHVMSNLYNLVAVYGPIKPFNEIASSNDKCVALVTFIKQMSPSTNTGCKSVERDCCGLVQVAFDEISLEPKPCVSNRYDSAIFTASFSGDLGKEIEKAVNNKHIEPGDLVGLIYPCVVPSKKHLPINVSFPSGELVNLIVMKNQLPCREYGGKIHQSDVNFSYSIDCNIRQELNSDNVDYYPIEFCSIKKCSSVESAILEVSFKLKKYGEILLLKQLLENSSLSFKSGIVTTYFLKMIKPNNCLSEDKKVTLVLKEVSFDIGYGSDIKLVLHEKFAKSFCLAVKDKTIVRGDIICLVNPVVWNNPQYTPNSYTTFLPYIVEIAIPEQQRIIVFRLREMSKDVEINLKIRSSNSVTNQALRIINICNTSHKTSGQLSEVHTESLTEIVENPPGCSKTLTTTTNVETPFIREREDTDYSNIAVDKYLNIRLKEKETRECSLFKKHSESKRKKFKTDCKNFPLEKEIVNTESNGRDEINDFSSTYDDGSNSTLTSHKGKISECYSSAKNHVNSRMLQGNCCFRESNPHDEHLTQNCLQELNSLRASAKLSSEYHHQNQTLMSHDQQNECSLFKKPLPIIKEHSDSDSTLTKAFTDLNQIYNFIQPEEHQKNNYVKFNQIHNITQLKEHHKKDYSFLTRPDEYDQRQQHKLQKKDNQRSGLNKSERKNDLILKPQRSYKHRLKREDHVLKRTFNKYKEYASQFPYSFKDNRNTSQLSDTNTKKVAEHCFLPSKCTGDGLKDGFPNYKPTISLLPIILTKPLLKSTLDLVAGYCKSGCGQMYPHSSIVYKSKDLSKPLCPRCSIVLKLDFCFEIVSTYLNKLIIALLHGPDAEKYLNVTCKQFLDYNESRRELIVKLFEERLEYNRSTGKGVTIETTNVTDWWFV